MDYKVIWSDDALRDVEDIANYIEKDSHYYASAVVTKIIDITRILSTFPFAGRVVPEESIESVREHFVYRYRVIYEVTDNNIVYVLAVVPGERLLQPILNQRKLEG